VIDAQGPALAVEPDEVEREAHAVRVDRARAREQQRGAGRQRVAGEGGESEGPRAAAVRDGDRPAAGERVGGEAGEAAGVHRGYE
jgi:hypothetical protein